MTSSPLASLSGFVICKNEEGVIENCLRSLDVCSEIVVVDSGSSDATPDIVRRLSDEGLPIRFIRHDWQGYAAQKQFALEHCTGAWCLSLDADERLDDELRAELPALLNSPDDVAGWRIPRRPYLIGYGYTPPGVAENRMVRLVRRGRASFDPADLVHEVLRTDGKVRDVERGNLLHFRILKLEDQFAKENMYSSLKLSKSISQGLRSRPWKMLVSPFIYFLRIFFGRRFYRCGWAGFIFAGTSSVYAFMAEAKLVQHELARQKPPREDKRI